MDTKKKLEEAYKPDQIARKEKVVIGLSGGIDSYVTAYLLKIQKYELVAVTVTSSWEYWDGDPASLFSCQLSDEKLSQIKEFCHKLNIPHYVIKNNQEFREEVIELAMAKRLEGKLPNPIWDSHALKMRLLYEKMLELKIKTLATGHFAKIFQQDGGNVFVHTSNEEEHDQSSLLSRLPHHILRSIMLPLSDLTRKEVLKLAENFGVTEEGHKNAALNLGELSSEMSAFFEKNVPSKLRPAGHFENQDGEEIGDEDFVFRYTYGSPVEIKGKGTKGYFAKYSPITHRMTLAGEDFFKQKSILLTNCHFSQGMIWSSPLKGFLAIGHDKWIECWVHPKNHSSAYLELSEEEIIKEGEILTVLKKKGKNAKVFLTGSAHLLPKVAVEIEGEESVPKVDYTRDY